MQYGMFYTHRCSYCTYSCPPVDEPKRFETCRRQYKLKLDINLENCAIRWFVLYNCITMHGVKNVKYT
jgi:hypothetical protein